MIDTDFERASKAHQQRSKTRPCEAAMEKQMADVRGKFTVTRISKDVWNKDGAEVVLTPQYTGSPEDNTYSSATPSGTITMTVTNPSALAKLEMGKAFYVDFTAVD